MNVYIEPELIKDLIATTDIVDVIRRFRPDLKKNGVQYFCKSPFNDEKTASFAVHPIKQFFKCFSSGKSGNVVEYLISAEKMEYLQAIKFLGDMYNVQLFDGKGNPLNAKPKSDYECRAAKVEEKDGQAIFKTKDFTMAELREIFSMKVISYCEQYWLKSHAYKEKDKKDIKKVYKSLFNVLSKYSVYSLQYYARVKDRKVHIFKSNERYPIFMFDYGTHRKFYQPKSEDKAFRFSYDGEKPIDFIFGYKETLSAYDKMQQDAKKKQADKNDETEETKKEEIIVRLDAVIECTGERDALNVAALGYEIICMSTESAIINPGKLSTLMGITDNYYRLPDIDKAGKESNHRVCLDSRSPFYLNIKTIWLPEELRLKKDFRGNPCKDVRDFLNYYTPKHLKNLMKVALPYRFWDEQKAYKKDGGVRIKFGKPVIQYVVNPIRTYNFLNMNGFYRLESKNDKRGYVLVRIEDNIVTPMKDDQVKEFINEFLKSRYFDEDLRNTFVTSTLFTENSLNNLSFTNIDFRDYTHTDQYFFFSNKIVKVDKNSIKELVPGSIDRFVWKDELVEHEFKLMDPFFKVTQEEGEFNIEILNKQCLFFRFLINSSRVHWNKELEKKLKDLPPKEQEEYLIKNRFSIDGPLLDEEEIAEQKHHLINKMYALGYLLHRYKTPSKPWAVVAMDNNISEEGDSHGGSGKSLAFQSLQISKMIKTVTLEGRKQKLTENNHIYENVTEATDLVLVDDANQYLNFDFFFSALSGVMRANPKNISSYEISFDQSPKFVFTTNFSIRNLDQSTLRRILFTSFSDYYHSTKGDRYQEARQPKDDFGKDLFLDYNEEEWNLFLNLCTQMCQLYLNYDKIEPPMGNVFIRNLKGEMGAAFNSWADVYFSPVGENLDKFIVRSEAVEDFKKQNPTTWHTHKFTKALKAWVALKGYKLNPMEIQNDSGRIIKRITRWEWKGTEKVSKSISAEMIYIQTLDKVVIPEEPKEELVAHATSAPATADDDLPF